MQGDWHCSHLRADLGGGGAGERTERRQVTDSKGSLGCFLTATASLESQYFSQNTDVDGPVNK